MPRFTLSDRQRDIILEALAAHEHSTALKRAGKLEVAELRGVIARTSEVELWLESEPAPAGKKWNVWSEAPTGAGWMVVDEGTEADATDGADRRNLMSKRLGTTGKYVALPDGQKPTAKGVEVWQERE